MLTISHSLWSLIFGIMNFSPIDGYSIPPHKIVKALRWQSAGIAADFELEDTEEFQPGSSAIHFTYEGIPLSPCIRHETAYKASRPPTVLISLFYLISSPTRCVSPLQFSSPSFLLWHHPYLPCPLMMALCSQGMLSAPNFA